MLLLVEVIDCSYQRATDSSLDKQGGKKTLLCSQCVLCKCLHFYIWEVKCVYISKRQKMNKPLKFGLIRASYPDVRPMSESRKSDGDMLEDDLVSYSLASTTLVRGEKKKHHLIREKSELRTRR